MSNWILGRNLEIGAVGVIHQVLHLRLEFETYSHTVWTEPFWFPVESLGRPWDHDFLMGIMSAQTHFATDAGKHSAWVSLPCLFHGVKHVAHRHHQQSPMGFFSCAFSAVPTVLFTWPNGTQFAQKTAAFLFFGDWGQSLALLSRPRVRHVNGDESVDRESTNWNILILMTKRDTVSKQIRRFFFLMNGASLWPRCHG